MNDLGLAIGLQSVERGKGESWGLSLQAVEADAASKFSVRQEVD